ncbi:FAD-dependent oxidoreductase [Paenibacillus sp. YN15]|uniref:FAD-dependent oxidoreductase n=1 Tax=Paenibacillus sp. YN15 TaxID=1742774 RepID=UPI0015EC4DBD|nr:FAD-dependent oxidoreductase [Paenibacillus sp. YN15]
MNRALSASSRPGLIHDLEAGTFDLLIIGGGITGAGIAWDAAKRGLKAVLIEQGDFASGTSSRSTKLIHGGLRYLKKGEIRLVREVGREREWLYGSAPHLLTPAPMLLPLYKGGTFGYWSASVGLAVYDRLAGVLKKERRVMLRAGRAAKQEPLLKGEGLKGAGLYYEYRSDDARLTVEVLKTANRHGALAINYMQAVDFLYYKSKVCGVKAVDRLSGMEVEIRAKKVVNAAGPWVDLVRAKDHAIRGKTLLLTKGIHLVVSQSKLPVKQAAYFDAPDGRMIFVIPRGKKTYIGTTDTVFNGDPNHVRVTESDRDYLLKAVTAVFPRVKLTANDVESMWAGLRPLIHQEGKSPSDISRKDEVWESPSGLITIAGGKLTGFRKMAEKTVDAIADRIAAESRQTFAPCTTDREIISGGDCGRCETYEEQREQLLEHGVKRGLNAKMVNELLDRYGSNMSKIYMRLAELDAGFRTWKPEPPAARRAGGRRMPEGGAPEVAPDREKRPPAAREEERGRAAAAGDRSRPAEPVRPKQSDTGTVSLPRTEASGRNASSSASSASSMSRKPATPENGKISAGERAAWIEEWNRREQQAAAASNAEERARWIREWNQRKRLAEETGLELTDGAAEAEEAETGEEETGEAGAAGTGTARGAGASEGAGAIAGAEAAAESGEAFVERERETPAAPPRQKAASGSVEEAWRQLEELTGSLRHGEPSRTAADSGGYERAAAEPQGREASERLSLRKREAPGEEESGRREKVSYGDDGAEAFPGQNNGWNDEETRGRRWSEPEAADERGWSEEAEARRGEPETGAEIGARWGTPWAEAEWRRAETDADRSAFQEQGEWDQAEADSRWDGAEAAADGEDPSDAEAGWEAEDQGDWADLADDSAADPAADPAAGPNEASGVQQEESSWRDDRAEPEAGEAVETDDYFNSLEYKLLKAEIQYCVEEEMAVQAADFLIRRTGLLYFDRERAEEIAIDVIEIMAELLNWSEDEVMNQKLQLAKEWELATSAFKWEQD